MSIANPPVYSNGDKTVSITMKSNWKWSNGQPLTAKDLLFTIDLIKAAVKVSPANWAVYVPGHFPDTLVSTSEPNASTLVVNLSAPVNPSWFTEDILGRDHSCSMPSSVWAKDFGERRRSCRLRPDPANVTKIFNFLTAQTKSVSTYATNPLWQTVDGPYKLTSLQRHQRRVHHGAEHHLRRPARDADVHLPGRPVHLERRAVQRHQGGQRRRRLRPPAPTCRSCRRCKGIGYNYFGMPDFGMTTSWPTTSRTRPATSTTSSPSCTSGRRCSTWRTSRAGSSALPERGRRPGLRTDPDLPAEPVPIPRTRRRTRTRSACPTAVSMLKANGWNVVPGGTDTCAQRRHRRRATCGAGIPPAPSWPSTTSTAPPRR